jgi:hypothetical protein
MLAANKGHAQAETGAFRRGKSTFANPCQPSATPHPCQKGRGRAPKFGHPPRKFLMRLQRLDFGPQSLLGFAETGLKPTEEFVVLAFRKSEVIIG